jgi:glycosyltransferase involved in cell wall biosynthesis
MVIDMVLRRASHRLICVAKSDYERGMRHGVVDTSRGVVLRLGIDVEKFRVQDERAGVADDEPRIVGTIGRLHVQKGHRYLLEAAVLVIKNDPRVRFVIVGGGELQAETEGWITMLGLEKHAELLGPRTDIPALLASMDLFVLPSLWEGLPLVLLEAMAAGKPIVSTAVDGVKEVITDEEALLVPPRNPEKLAEAILKILNDPDLAQRLRERAMQKVRREFSVERMVREMEKLYTDLVRT